MKNKILVGLLKQPETVFTLSDIALLFPESSYNNLKQRLSYLAVNGHLKSPRRGIYVKDNYNIYELANKIYNPSYVSLETVLLDKGVIFQFSSYIFSISQISRNIIVDNRKLIYKKIKDEILYNNKGVEKENGADVATVERAFLDTVFLYKNYYFDNLGVIDWEKVEDIIDIYGSKILKKRIDTYYKNYIEEKKYV